MLDPFNLQRFVEAQATVYPRVVKELRSGRKDGHWMWFIFPQLKGLGHSSTSRFYAISSLEEARLYLEHPILGTRLRECTELVISTKDRTARAIFGPVDEQKFRSSMTLFSLVSPAGSPFHTALSLYFEGGDEATIRILQKGS